MTIEKKVKLNIKLLKEKGAPIIIVGAVQESEAVANACRDFGIVISAFCDSEPRKSKDILASRVISFRTQFGFLTHIWYIFT